MVLNFLDAELQITLTAFDAFRWSNGTLKFNVNRFDAKPRIKGLIAALAEFKINVLHLHLTDTASWPLEIEGYPEIARKLSYRDINGKALTYSRQDIRNLVESLGHLDNELSNGLSTSI